MDIFAKLASECNRLFGTNLGENANAQEVLDTMAGQMPIAQAEGFESRLSELTTRLDNIDQSALDLAGATERIGNLETSLGEANTLVSGQAETIVALETQIGEMNNSMGEVLNASKGAGSVTPVAAAPAIPVPAATDKKADNVNIDFSKLSVETSNPFPQFVN